MPVTYSIEEPELLGHASNISAPEAEHQLPFLDSFGNVWISIDVSGPVDINRLDLVPNDIRGMAAYIAYQCVGRRGVGGFVTKRIQGLVDFVTDPASDIDDTIYPDSAAFLTLTVSTHQYSHAFPGDYDPQLAYFLQEAEIDALSRVEPRYRTEITNRAAKFADARLNMCRLGTEVPWWFGWLGQQNRTAVSNVQTANTTTGGIATSRRRKRIPDVLPQGSPGSEASAKCI